MKQKSKDDIEALLKWDVNFDNAMKNMSKLHQRGW